MNEVTQALGRLERVDPRSIWQYEDKHFTPWLAEEDNLRLLGEVIGFDLELEAQEKDVGPFRADILCKDTLTDAWVLIENQLERTDHTHLGQLITYAAGLKAVTIVWVANPFTDEHRAALDWLNEITDSRFNFFGLEIELWRIGESPVAPKFNVVCQPNDWSKTVGEGAKQVEHESLTEYKQLQLQFWTAFRSFVESQDTVIRTTKAYPQSYMGIAIGRTGFFLSAVASQWNSEKQNYDNQEMRCELVIDGKDAKTYFSLLKADKMAIDEELGLETTWHATEGTQMCRIYVIKQIDFYDEAEWPNYHKWLLEHLEIFNTVFKDRVRNLRLPERSS